MEKWSEGPRPPVGHDEVLHSLGAFVWGEAGRRSIVAVNRHPLDWGHRSRFDSVQFVMRGGQTVSVVLKDFNPPRSSVEGARVRYTRERVVYSDLLAPARLETPRYYGSTCDPGLPRFWLAMEHVAGEQLHLRDPQHFEMAATWLGRLQVHFRQRFDRSSDGRPLVAHDGAFFQSWTARARDLAASLPAGVARRMERVLAAHESAVVAMAAEPGSLVHGAFKRRHVLVGPGRSGVRICPVDWECAALGSPLFDLARIMEGCTPPTRERMFAAYRDELVKNGVPHHDGWRMRHLLACFRLHHAVAALAELTPGPQIGSAATRITGFAEKLARQIREESFDE